MLHFSIRLLTNALTNNVHQNYRYSHVMWTTKIVPHSQRVQSAICNWNAVGTSACLKCFHTLRTRCPPNRVTRYPLCHRQRLNEPAAITLSDDPNTMKSRKTAVISVVQSRKKGHLAESIVLNSSSRIQPYLKLMRFDKPIGSLLLFWPAAWSAGLALNAGGLPDPYIMGLLFVSSVLMRSAVCIVNDMIDKDIDSKVERTKSRPLASGQLNMRQAMLLLTGNLSLGLLVLSQLNSCSLWIGIASTGLLSVYPFMKRLTYWPQLFLGFSFNCGAFFGWSAIHGTCYLPVCLSLYFGCISWTLVYDTIYGHQDKNDDIKIGVKSTALAWGNGTKRYLCTFTGVMATGLCLAGTLSEQTLPYYASLGMAATYMLYQVATMNLDNAKQCGQVFNDHNRIGLIIMAGIIAGTLMKKKKSDSNDKSIADVVLQDQEQN